MGTILGDGFPGDKLSSAVPTYFLKFYFAAHIFDIGCYLSHLGDISGEITTDEILGAITLFSGVFWSRLVLLRLAPLLFVSIL